MVACLWDRSNQPNQLSSQKGRKEELWCSKCLSQEAVPEMRHRLMKGGGVQISADRAAHGLDLMGFSLRYIVFT